MLLGYNERVITLSHRNSSVLTGNSIFEILSVTSPFRWSVYKLKISILAAKCIVAIDYFLRLFVEEIVT